MRNVCKKEKGITLVSLVITIVIMIILASVSINYSTDSIQHSNYMAMYSEIQIIQEKVNLYNSEDKEIVTSNLEDSHKTILESKSVSSDKYANYSYFTSAAIEKAFDINGIKGEYLISIENRDIICLSTIIKDSNEFVNYRLEDISDEYNVSEMPKLSELASIGDYVNYDPTVGEKVTSQNTKYTSLQGGTTYHGNGYGEQTFSAAAYKASGGKWRILNIDENGTITLISDLIYQDDTSTGKMGTKGFYLQGGIGYIWGEEELHRICAIYGYGNGADTSKTIQYYYGGPNDQDGSIAEIDEDNDGNIDNLAELQQGRRATLKVDGTDEVLTSGARSIIGNDLHKIYGKNSLLSANYFNAAKTQAKNANNAKYYPTLDTINTTTGQSEEQTSFSGNYYYTLFYYNIGSTIRDDMLKLGKVYWFASRARGGSSVGNDLMYLFAFGKVNADGAVDSNTLCNCSEGNWVISASSNPVRAIVTLNRQVKTTDEIYPGDDKGWNLVD